MAARRTGLQVVVCEQADRVGGLAASTEVGGIRVDLGSHRLHPSMPAEVRAEIDRILGDDLQVRRRRGRIRLDGRWLAFPLRPGDLLRRASPSFLVGVARDLALAPWRRPDGDDFASLVEAHMGPTVAQRFYLPYARKLWDTDGSRLSGELYRRRVSGGSAAGLVRRALTRPSGSGTTRGTFLYPRRGFGQLSERLANDLVAAGVDLRLSSPVTSLRTTGAGGEGLAVGLGPGVSIEAPTVVSTLPTSVVVALSEPSPPPAVVASVARLRHRGMVLVYLVLEGPQFSPFDAHYLVDPAVATSRVSEPTRFRDGPDPSDRTVLCAEVPAWVGDERWRADDAAVVDGVLDDLARSGFGPLAAVESRVVRVPRVYPVYELGHEADQAVVEAWAASIPGLVLVGRQGLFAHDNTHHALAMGWAAGACLQPDGTLDGPAWTRAREGFRDHVVED